MNHIVKLKGCKLNEKKFMEVLLVVLNKVPTVQVSDTTEASFVH
jgi:hypothetical protein